MTENTKFNHIILKVRQKTAHLKEFFTHLPDNRHALYYVLALSILIKIIIFIALFHKPINNDGILYISAAKQIAQGNFKDGINIYRMPLYPLLIVGFHFIISDWVIAGRLISLMALVLSIIPLYLITRNLFDSRVAFWSCLAFAIVPVPNHWSIYVIRGPVFVLFFAWAVYFAVRAICHKEVKYFFLAAVFSWTSVFFRIEGIFFIPLFLIFLTVLLLVKTDEKRYIFKGLLIWIAFPLSLVTLLYFSQKLGLDVDSFNRFDFVLHKINKVFNFRVFEKYREISDYLEQIKNHEPFSGYHQSFAVLFKKYIPLFYFLGMMEKLIKVLFLFNIIPLIKGFRHKIRRNHLLVLSTIVVFIVLVYVRMIEKDFLSSRFLFIAAFLLFPWVGHGMARILTSIKQKPKFKLLFGVFLLFFIVAPLGKIVKSLNQHDTVLIQAGEWLKEIEGYKKTKIVVNDTRILFYSDREVFLKNSKMKGDNHLIYHHMKEDYSILEPRARQYGGELIVMRVSKKERNKIPDFNHYKIIKEFEGKKNLIQVFLHQNSSIQ